MSELAAQDSELNNAGWVLRRALLELGDQYIYPTDEWTRATRIILEAINQQGRSGSRETQLQAFGVTQTIAIRLAAPTEAQLADARQAARSYLPYEYVMPCGTRYQFDSVEDIALTSVPCSCGDPTHWKVLCVVDPSLDRRGQ